MSSTSAELADAVRCVGMGLLERRRSAIPGKGVLPMAAADAWAHETLYACLQRVEPRLPIVSEENEASKCEIRPARYWLIDPIDGTASFVEGYSGFVVQAALMIEHVPVLAVVFAPALDRCYVAERGGGAFVNGKRMMASPVYPPRSLVDNYPTPRGIALEAYNALSFRKYVESGSIGLKICMVAEGTADVFFKNVTVRDWDLAAPHRVLMEAGGMLTDMDGQDIPYTGPYERHGLVAALHSQSHADLLRWYRERKAQT
jgi:3'(2'), 5'-bisphosphate nucleotidase